MIVCTISELDMMFGYNAAKGRGYGSWWAHNWRRMVAEHGFPAPLPGFGRPRWSRVLVEKWANSNGRIGQLTAAMQSGGEAPPPEIEPNLAALERAR